MITVLASIFNLTTTTSHVEDSSLPEGVEGESLHIEGYDITFIPSDTRFYVGKELSFAVHVIAPDGKLATGIDVQGSVLDFKTRKPIYYAAISEVQKGVYAFSWKPSFAGRYFSKFLLRLDDQDSLTPTFEINVKDKRAEYSIIGSIFIAIASLAFGMYASLSTLFCSKKSKRKNRKNKDDKIIKKFRIAPIIYGIGIGVLALLLGYSVSYFYQSGAERGFIVCGQDGCNLAVHWHTQLAMSVCGKPYHLPLEAGDLENQHTHKENDRLHFHALVKIDESGTELLEPEKLRVGGIFDQLGVRFTSKCFDGYCNNDLCSDGKSGKLKMAVNGIANEQYADYVWKDGDVISIVFAP